MNSLWLKVITFIGVFLYFPVLGQAKYQNPEVKILIFSTHSNFSLSSPTGIVLQASGQRLGNKLQVSFLGNKRLQVGRLAPGTAVIRLSSLSPILVKHGGHKTRRYRGDMVLVPYKKGVYLVNYIQTESYLEGVLAGEIKTTWPIEAVKAQAVIARTYALYRRFERRNALWHLVSGTGDQVYLGVDADDPKGRLAISATRGVVVSYKGRLAQTFYHTNCGGMTEDPGVLWDFSLPYYHVVEVPFGEEDPIYNWEFFLSSHQALTLLRKFGFSSPGITGISVLKRTESGRAYWVQFNQSGQKTVLAKDFRRLVGYTKIKSLMFDIIPVQKGFLVRGQGNGHGVGLCQWAAKEMATKGYSYQDILHFFYRPVDLGYYDG